MIAREEWPGGILTSERPGYGVVERWVHSVGGVGLTYWPAWSVLLAEASLPKQVAGVNYEELTPAEEIAALELVDFTIRGALDDKPLPRFAGWSPHRLDSVRQVRVGSRPRLLRLLRALRDAEVSRWGLPVVGQAYSCTWGRRTGQRARAYDKWREVTGAEGRGGSPEASRSAPCPDDLLRVEGVLRRPKVIGRLMGTRTPTVASALASGVAERPLMRVWPVIERLMEVDVRDDEVMWRLVKKYGWVRGSRLLGFARFLAEVGVDELGEHMGRATVWRNVRDLREAGVEPSEVRWSPGTGAGIAGPVGRWTRKMTVLKREQEGRARGARRSTA